jgi:hypothetical protein
MFTQILNSARDLATILIIIYVLVKSGPLTSAARDFFKRASAFMTTTENTMSVIRSNHLAHIQKALETLVENEKK